MEHIGDISLTDNQKTLIKGMINMYGTGEHPYCDEKTFNHFTIEYIKELSGLSEVAQNLSPKGLETLTEITQILENPKCHYDVEVNSLWDYDRSLDNAKTCLCLKVKTVKDGAVGFYEDMPYKSYGITYFDGKTFKPHVPK